MKLMKPLVPFWPSVFGSIFVWSVVVLSSIFFNLIGFLVLPVSLSIDHGTRRLLHIVSGWWARAIMTASPFWRFKVEGSKNIQPGKNYVIVANHQSMLDILAVLSGLGIHFKFIAKKALFPIPFMGWHMSLAGYIPVDRGNFESGKGAILEAERWLRNGVSVLFFPEGTRSPDGEIRDFKIGAFKIAHDLGLEVLPVVINGTSDTLPKKSWLIRKKARILLSVGKPINLEKEIADGMPKVRDTIRCEMIGRLAGIRRRAS